MSDPGSKKRKYTPDSNRITNEIRQAIIADVETELAHAQVGPAMRVAPMGQRTMSSARSMMWRPTMCESCSIVTDARRRSLKAATLPLRHRDRDANGNFFSKNDANGNFFKGERRALRDDAMRTPKHLQCNADVWVDHL